MASGCGRLILGAVGTATYFEPRRNAVVDLYRELDVTISSNESDSREAESGTSIAAADIEPVMHAANSDPVPRKREKVRRSTSHLKAVPEVLAHRERFKAEAERYAQFLDK